MKMREKVKIHIFNSKQDTTATWILNNLDNTNSWICTLESIPDLQWLSFWKFSKVRIVFDDGRIKEALFYLDSSKSRLIQFECEKLEFWSKISMIESEDNNMLHKVTITKSEEKVLEEYWLMRAIRENQMTKAKTVVKESECTKEPTLEEIALFLSNSGGNFVSVEHNYRFADLPF